MKIRAEKSHQRYVTSLGMEWLFVSLALLTVATTFIFLTYEMLGRRRAARKIVAGNVELQAKASVRALEETAYQATC